MKRLNPFTVDGRGRSWFWYGVSLGTLLALLIWWLLKQEVNNNKDAIKKVDLIVLPDDEAEGEGETPEPDGETTQQVEEATHPKKDLDDLKLIEGIGPRSAQVLVEAGVTRFTHLAKMDPDAIHVILRDAGVRVPYPETWPEQANLAAAGKWNELKALQNTLQGGRRI